MLLEVAPALACVLCSCSEQGQTHIQRCETVEAQRASAGWEIKVFAKKTLTVFCAI